jgi:hypothetical protein
LADPKSENGLEMIALIAFHVLMVALALVVITGMVSPRRMADMIGNLHKAIGITAPTLEQGRMAALIWIGSAIVIVDGCLLLLLFIVSISKTG